MTESTNPKVFTIFKTLVAVERDGVAVAFVTPGKMEAEAPAMYAFIQKIVDHANLQPRGQAFNMDDLHVIEIDQTDGDEARAILERIDQ